MRKFTFLTSVLVLAFLLCGIQSNAQRYMEKLNRGVIAHNKGTAGIYVGWRMFGTDPSTIGFNLYRSANGATAVKLNSAVITDGTNFIDATADKTVSNMYYVKAVVSGVEQAASVSYTLPANTAAKQYTSIPLKYISDSVYNCEHVYVGDLDGDGDYDFIVKRFPDQECNTIKLDAYTNEGVFLWRVDLGVGVETGSNSSATSPVLVYDFNNDGRAEIVVKTGEGTVFGDGTKIGDTNGDGKTDYRNLSLTYNILSGPEFLSLLDPATGKEMARTKFIDREDSNISVWGDNYGHRMNFIFAGVAYFDGVNPSIIFSRGVGGYYMKVQAWDLTSNAFVSRFTWKNDHNSGLPTGKNYAEFHAIRCLDLDGDGKDEVSWGGFALDHTGTLLYGTDVNHGDRFQIGDFDPTRAGLEAYVIGQNDPNLVGAELYDAATGTSLKKMYQTAVGDVGRGDVADIDPNYKGMELFSYVPAGTTDCKGNTITTTTPSIGLSIWWDGDLGREFFAGIGGTGENPAITKWNYTASTTDRVWSMYNDGGSYAVKCNYAGRPPFYGDILGDWREEIVLETSNHSELRIYTTTNYTSTRLYTLMHNPAYRLSTVVKGYLQSTYPDYYLGYDMTTPAQPNIAYPNEVSFDKIYSVTARHSAKTLMVATNTTGEVVHQLPYAAHYNYQWGLADAGFGYVTFKNQYSLKYFDVTGSSLLNNATIQQNSYSGADNQLFTLKNVGNGYYNIISKVSGKALDLAGASTADNTNLIQYTLGTGYNQQFSFTYLRNKSLQLNTDVTDVTESNGFSVYPNPIIGSSVEISTTLSAKSDVEISIINSLGVVVCTKKISQQSAGALKQTLALPELASGMYLVQLRSNEGIQTAKIVK